MAQTNGSVLAVAQQGGIFYIGGTFTSVINPDGSSVARNRLAAIDASTGYATAWNPGADNDVVVIVPNVGTIYVGGAFANIGGAARSRAGAVDAATGLATAWDPQPNGTVFSMILSGTTMYMGGAFFQIAGINRFFLGAVSATGAGALLAWNPSADNFVFSLAQRGNIIYAGGTFLNVGGMGRPRIAAIDATTGVPTAWNPASNNIVLSVAADASQVYAGGFFATIGGGARQGIAALDATTGLLVPTWNANCNNGVLQVLPRSTDVIAGGNFTSIGGSALQNLGLLTTGGGSSTNWTASNANGQIEFNGLAAVPGEPTVLVGGQFTNICGQARGYFAVIDQPVPTAIYSTRTFNETPTNTGTVGSSALITLQRTSWALPPGTVLMQGTHYTASGIPAGLSVFARVLTSDAVQLFLTGQATSHAAGNSTSAAQITFTDATVQNGNAALVNGLNGQPLRVQFFDSVPPPIVSIPAPPPNPTITDFSPKSGSMGTVVTIRGRNLGRVQLGSFGGIQVGMLVVESDSVIRATVGAGGTGVIRLVTPDTTITSLDSFTFISNSPTVATQISESAGTFGTRVIITGLGFLGVTGVRFGEAPVLSFSVDSDSQITVIVGGGASGTVSLTTPQGRVFTNLAFEYISPQQTQITDISPKPVVTGDDSFLLTVIGKNLPFAGQYEVSALSTNATFAPIRVSAQNISSTSAELRIPLQVRRAGEYRLTLTLPGLQVLSTTFTVANASAPVFTVQTVNSTIASGEAFRVVLFGRGFFRRGASLLTLNGALTIPSQQDSTSITVEIPSEQNVRGQILRLRLTNFDGQSTEATVEIISRNAPLITGLQAEWGNEPMTGRPALSFRLRGLGFMPPLSVRVENRDVQVLEASEREFLIRIPDSMRRPALDEPPLVLLMANSDRQMYGYRIAPQMFYPVQPLIQTAEAMTMLRGRNGAFLIGLPILGTGFQPGTRAKLDSLEIDVLNISPTRCVVNIPQALILPLSQLPKTVRITLMNPGALSTTALVRLRFPDITAEEKNGNSLISQLFSLPTGEMPPKTDFSETNVKVLSALPLMQIFPQPASETLTLQLSRSAILPTESLQIRCFDVQGGLLFEEKIVAMPDEHTLFVGNLARGLYFLEISYGRSKERLKFLKF